jgi:hypothetical protein
MKTNPYTLATDGGNDSDLTKLNPLTLNIFDIFLNKVTSNFLDMCTTKGATTAYKFEKNWQCYYTKSDKCVGFSVDKVSVNMVKRNAIKSWVLVETSMCTLLAVLAMWHIMQHVKEEIAFL